MRRPEVEKLTGLGRSTIYDLMGKGRFPKPVKLGENIVAWLSYEIEDWMTKRIAERDK
jgi:prophage regulatory protein